MTVFPLSPPAAFLLLAGLGDTRHSCVQPGRRLPAVARRQTLLRAILGPPPTQRRGVGGAAPAAPTRAAQRPPQARRRTRSLEPPGSRRLGLPQAESVGAWGARLWRRPEQQVGPTERQPAAGCDGPFSGGVSNRWLVRDMKR